MSQDNFAWNVTFFAGASEIINRIATTGLLGIVALFLIIAAWTAESFRTLTGEDEDEGLPLAIFGGWLAVVVAMFYYPFNFSLAMMFWLFLGLIVAMDEGKIVALPLKSVRLTYAVTLVFVAVMVLELGLIVWNAKRYYAEAQYLDAVKSLQKNDLPGAMAHLEASANSTDRLQDNYLTGLSQIYLAQARQELNKQDSKPEDAIKAASPYIQTAVQAAMLSTNIANPNNSANWAARGYVYHQLIGISEGFDAWAIDMYNKALVLEPNNPSLWTEIGQVYILKKDMAKARESFNKAIALRPQLIDPHYYLALLDDQQGDKAAAIAELETIGQLLPADDQASKDNVIKAIENLKSGKSLSGQSAGQPQPMGGDAMPSQPTVSGSPAWENVPESGTESGAADPGAVAPQLAVPAGAENAPAAPVKK
jgi:cytochrome c-type biogenesis protein CcmH/NrfG